MNLTLLLADKSHKIGKMLFCLTDTVQLFTLTITRSPAQKSACKDLSRNGQRAAITSEATYTPTSKRAGSRSLYKRGNPHENRENITDTGSIFI